MLRLPELELDYEAARAGWELSADGQAGGRRHRRRDRCHRTVRWLQEVAPGQPQDRRRLLLGGLGDMIISCPTAGGG